MMRQVNLMKIGGRDMVEVMTDKQFDKIIKMISMILDGCKDLDEAKKKVHELADTAQKEE